MRKNNEYRGAKRIEAKVRNLDWRKLERKKHNVTLQIEVVLPPVEKN